MILTDLYELMDGLSEDDPCSFECSTALLGTLYKNMKAKGLYPKPSTPLHGYSISEVVAAIEDFRQLQIGGKFPKYQANLEKWSFGCSCTLSDRLSPFVERWKSKVNGLRYDTCETLGHSNSLYGYLYNENECMP